MSPWMLVGAIGGLAGVAVIVAVNATVARAKDAIATKDAALAEMVTQRDYWRTRAERLMDAALVRAGAVHQQTMETPAPRNRVDSAAAIMTAALSVREIDSSKSRREKVS